MDAPDDWLLVRIDSGEKRPEGWPRRWHSPMRPKELTPAAVLQFLNWQIFSLDELYGDLPNQSAKLAELTAIGSFRDDVCDGLAAVGMLESGSPLPSLPMQVDLPMALDLLQRLRNELEGKTANAAKSNRNPSQRKRRKRQAVREPQPLTARQTEVLQIVAECKGNIAEAARRLGRDRKTVQESHDAAMSKLGTSAAKGKIQRLPMDRRGQANIANDDDRRG